MIVLMCVLTAIGVVIGVLFNSKVRKTSYLLFTLFTVVYVGANYSVNYAITTFIVLSLIEFIMYLYEDKTSAIIKDSNGEHISNGGTNNSQG